MAIISFWSNGKTETGKAAAMAAITTFLAVQHNFKILVLDTKYNDHFYQDCYWHEDKTLKRIYNQGTKINIASGLSGLTKAILSNKTSPEIITNFTKVVFKDRLEVLTDTDIVKSDYDESKKVLKDIAQIASRYYDLVFIDIDSNLDYYTTNSLLDISDIVVANISQKIRQINAYIKEKKENKVIKKKTVIPLLGKFDENSKYSAKNVSRYLKEREIISTIPYNTLFFEACNEGEVADFFIKFRKINPKDRNALFLQEVKNTAERIIIKLQELQMRM